ncbi:MAG TPA: hypothetical protein VM098_08310 [Phycisphaerae bacterium]|nr:hypothetical protein [Phycisphaerae bacterium]
MQRNTIALVALAVAAIPSLTSHAATYSIGFAWDWRVDFGTPTSEANMPPNPNSDARSRALAANAGLSTGAVVSDVWAYGRSTYSKVSGVTFAAGDFTAYTNIGIYPSNEDCRWDANVMHGDRIGYCAAWIPTRADGHYIHPADSSFTNPPVAAVIRWTYPGDTTIDLHIDGNVIRWDTKQEGQDGVDFYIFKNSGADRLDYATLGFGGIHNVDLTTGISPGDTLYLALGYLSNSTSDGTGVALTFEVIPEPATLGLLALGLPLLPKHKRRL